MKKNFILQTLLLAAFIITACNGTKNPNGKPSAPTHNVSLAPQDSTVANLFKSHEKEIRERWKKGNKHSDMFKYATAKNLLYVVTEDEQEGLLVHFHTDAKNAVQLSFIDKEADQEVSLIGDVVKVFEKQSDKDMKTIYYRVPNQDAIERLVIEQMKGGGYNFFSGDGYQMSADQAVRYIEEINKGVEVPLNKELSLWKNL